MITAKNLKKLLEVVPDDAKIHAYEGEDTGLCINMADGSFQWIRAQDINKEDKQKEFTLTDICNDRPVSVEFIKIMEEKLQQGRINGYVGWDRHWNNTVFPHKDMCGATGYFINRLQMGVLELAEAITKGRVSDITKEAADIANFAMFVADTHGGLEVNDGIPDVPPIKPVG